MFKSIEELRSYCKENEIVMIDFKWWILTENGVM